MSMRQSLAKRAGLIAVSCLLSSLSYPGYGQEVPLGPAQSLLQEALEHVYNSEYELAEQACEQVIASYRGHEYDARLMLAAVYQAQGRLTEAIEQAQLALAKVTRLYPDDSQRITAAQGALSRLVKAQSSFSEQLAQYQRIIEQQPNTGQALNAQYRMGCVYAFYFKYDQAIAQFANLIKEHPRSAEAIKAFSILQMVFVQAGRPQEALTVLPELVMTHCSGNPQMLLELCQFYRNQGKLGQAVPLAETIAASFPESAAAPGALLVAAGGYRLVGRLDYAQAAAERVVTDYPDSDEVTRALQHLLSIYEAHEGLEAAGAKLWALAAKYPDTKVATATGEIMTQVAGGRYEEGVRLGGEERYEEAAAMLREAIHLAPPEAWIAAKAQWELTQLAQTHPIIREVEILPARFERVSPTGLSLTLRAADDTTRIVGIQGNTTFRVTKIRGELPWVTGKVVYTELSMGLSLYEIQVSFGPVHETGSFNTVLIIETNDADNAAVRVPLTVDVFSPSPE